jgi:hypothetical protein
VASSGGAIGASENGSTTIWGGELGARALGELSSWSLGAGELGELGELVPVTPFELAENDPSSVCRAQRVQSPELVRNPAQLGQVGWAVLRRAMWTCFEHRRFGASGQ